MSFSSVVSGIFGGGGGDGGDGGAGEMAKYLAWLQQQQAKMDQLDAREQLQADTSAAVRRNDLLDRSGFSGLVNVGDATKRTDSTLATQMAALPDDDPQKMAYNAAIAQETQDKALQQRILSGEQFKAEDALDAFAKTIDSSGIPDDLETQLAKLKQTYSWLDTSAQQEAIKKRRALLNTPQADTSTPAQWT